MGGTLAAPAHRATSGRAGPERTAPERTGTEERRASRQRALSLVAGAPGLASTGLISTGLVSTAGDRVVGRGVDQVLPVAAELRPVLPWAGLRRGATISVTAATGSMSLLFALLAAASRAGAWCAAVGFPALGVLAAAEVGVVTDRLVLVPRPGPEWPATASALLDGLDVVLVRSPGRVAPAQGQRLAARARTRGAVLLVHGDWPGADVTLRPEAAAWAGLGDGRGRLRERLVTVHARGRGTASRPTETGICLPTPAGTLAAAPSPAAEKPENLAAAPTLPPAGDRRTKLVPVAARPSPAEPTDLPGRADLPDQAGPSGRGTFAGREAVG
jgi:hypothetical protein